MGNRIVSMVARARTSEATPPTIDITTNNTMILKVRFNNTWCEKTFAAGTHAWTCNAVTTKDAAANGTGFSKKPISRTPLFLAEKIVREKGGQFALYDLRGRHLRRFGFVKNAAGLDIVAPIRR